MSAIEERWKVIRTLNLFLAFSLAAISSEACLGRVQVLVDHVGYDLHADKQAILVGAEEDRPERYFLIDWPGVLEGRFFRVAESGSLRAAGT
jgi:hypothetical protein